MQIYNLSIHFLQMSEYEQPGLSKLSVWLLTWSIHSVDSQLNLGKHFGEATSHQVPLFTLGLKTGNITLKIHLRGHERVWLAGIGLCYHRAKLLYLIKQEDRILLDTCPHST